MLIAHAVACRSNVMQVEIALAPMTVIDMQFITAPASMTVTVTQSMTVSVSMILVTMQHAFLQIGQCTAGSCLVPVHHGSQPV